MAKVLTILRLFIIIFTLYPLFSTMAHTKRINILLPANRITLDPNGVIDQSSLWVNRQIHCQLFRQEGRNIVNDASESFKYETPTKLIVVLKSNLKFSSGEPVTINDVVYSITSLKKKRKVLRNILNWITSVKPISKNSMVFNLRASVPQFQRFLTSPHYAIFPKSFLIKVESNEKLWEKPPGCGFFKIKDRDKNSISLISQNQMMNEIVFWYRDTFKEKSADFYDIIPALSAVQSKPNENFRTEKIFDPYQLFIALNTNSSKFNKKGDRCEFFSSLDTTKLRNDLGSEYSEAKDIFPRGILGFSENSNWIEFYQSFKKKEKLNELKVTFLSISVPPIVQPIYEKWLKTQASALTTTTLENPKNFGLEFKKSGFDALIFGFKSNYLDGYEYLLIMGEDTANPTGLNDLKLKTRIESSQDINDNLQRAQIYQSLSDEIKNHCILYPLTTLSYKKVFIKKELETPNIGKATLNDYDLKEIK